jgi:hypothetical protein
MTPLFSNWLSRYSATALETLAVRAMLLTGSLASVSIIESIRLSIGSIALLFCGIFCNENYRLLLKYCGNTFKYACKSGAE